jgi:hypothetical protein
MGRKEQIQARVSKELTLAQAKKDRDALIDAPINNFDVARLIDRENLQGAINFFDALAQGGSTIVWTMSDNSDKTVTKEELEEVITTYVARKAMAFANYQALKETLQ